MEYLIFITKNTFMMELSPMDKTVIPGLFSPQEKQSLYQVMCAVRQIGSHHMSQKLEHIQEVMAITGITSQDQVQSRTMSQQQMTGILKRMTDIKKLYFAKFVSITGLIGGISEKETMFINWLYSEINVPTDF